jgi:hypothetical protein
METLNPGTARLGVWAGRAMSPEGYQQDLEISLDSVAIGGR